MRSDIGIAAVIRLRIADIGHPFGEKTGHVTLEESRLRKGLDIAQPSLAFGALGTVSWHAVHVAPLHPLDTMHNLVDKFIGTGKRAGLRRRGMEHPAQDGIFSRPAGQARHFHVTESMIGKVRFPFSLTPAPSILVDLGGPAQIVGINRAVVVEHLSVAHSDFGSRRRIRPEPAPPHHILAHIKNIDARLRLSHLHGPQLLHHADRLVTLRNQNRPLRLLRIRQYLSRQPPSTGKIRLVPAVHLLRSIVRFPEVNPGPADRPVGRRLP